MSTHLELLTTDERRRVKLSHMADFDFGAVCVQIHASAMTVPNHPERDPLANPESYDNPCPICTEMTSMDGMCMPCVRVATKIVADTATMLGTGFFRQRRIGEIQGR